MRGARERENLPSTVDSWTTRDRELIICERFRGWCGRSGILWCSAWVTDEISVKVDGGIEGGDMKQAG